MKATLTPTRTGFDLTATLADGWRALRSAAAESIRRWHAAHERRQAEIALSQLSLRTLRDLGLDRSEIPSIADAVGGNTDPTRRRMADF